MKSRAYQTARRRGYDFVDDLEAAALREILRDGHFDEGAGENGIIANPRRWFRLKILRACGYVKGRNRGRELKVTRLGRRVLRQYEAKRWMNLAAETAAKAKTR